MFSWGILELRKGIGIIHPLLSISTFLLMLPSLSLPHTSSKSASITQILLIPYLGPSFHTTNQQVDPLVSESIPHVRPL